MENKNNNKISILCVDDSRFYRLSASRLLTKAGYTVIEAEDGLAGIAMACEKNPDMILMGMNMPGLDGFEATTRIKSIAALADTPVVALTAHNRKGDRERCLAAGCVGYIGKHTAKAEFVAKVESYLWGKQESIAREQEASLLKAYNQKLVMRLEEKLRQLAHYNNTLAERVSDAVRELDNAQAHLLQSEKMAAIGQLAAGMAHEINNPIGFVHSNLGTLGKYVVDLHTMMAQYQAFAQQVENTEPSPQIQTALQALQETASAVDLDFLLDDLSQVVQESRQGTDRVRCIVQHLKDFSRIDRDEAWAEGNVNQLFENTLTLVEHELKIKAVLVKEYGETPQICCHPNQLEQVFMNLLMNACHSLGEHGEIHITTRYSADDEKVMVEIEDNGQGIAEHVLPKIFDPFFTTKSVGQGTGLGLSISYGIVQAHGGTIRVRSKLGVGTCFTVSLPVKKESLSAPLAH